MANHTYCIELLEGDHDPVCHGCIRPLISGQRSQIKIAGIYYVFILSFIKNSPLTRHLFFVI